MAQRGRKPKPTAVKELEGNPGKRPLNKNEPKPRKRAPACPADMCEEGKKEWNRLYKNLEELGLLTELDISSFEAYCTAYGRWKAAEALITKHGSIYRDKNGGLAKSPMIDIAIKYLTIANRYAEQFGLTPSSRSRIEVVKTISDEDTFLRDILDGRGD
jgi:P27 family predicted phage terminase small subunit